MECRDGRYVAFHSSGTQLVPGDTNFLVDVFVHDRAKDTTSIVSVGRLFAAGILPGILIGLSLITIATILSRKYGYGAALPFSWRRLLKNFLTAIPALGAPLIILGGILGGIFTATESAAAAVFYSLLVGFFLHRELTLKDLKPIFIEGSVIAAIVMAIFADGSSSGIQWVVWLHVLAGVAWIGLLYYFNFVQVPALGEAAGDEGGPGPAAWGGAAAGVWGVADVATGARCERIP